MQGRRMKDRAQLDALTQNWNIVLTDTIATCYQGRYA